MTFSLTLLHPARKGLDKPDNKSAKRIIDRLEDLKVDPSRVDQEWTSIKWREIESRPLIG
jgi:hypothetical protein